MEQQLRKILSSSDGQSHSVNSHLVEVLIHILQNKPERLYENFESISAFVKKNTFNFKELKSDTEIGKMQSRKIDLSDWSEECKKLFAKFTKTTEQGFKVVVQPPGLGIFSDLLKDNQILQMVGVSFGEEETMRIQLSLRNLMRSSGAISMRFWGKIYGREKDYYIAEGLLENAGREDIPRPKGFEKRGTGLNKFTYWVTESILEDWVELPDVTPQHIQQARQIKKIFTGRLDAEINSYPIFSGKERHLLRAQIARISSACIIIPKGIYKTNEEEPTQIDVDEEASVPGFEELNSDESWAHYHPYILKAGRATHAEPEVPPGEEVDLEELKAKQEENDKSVDRLRAISEDDPLQGEEKSWVISSIGDTQVYAAKPPQEGSVTYAVTLVRNLRWPGNYTVYKGGRWVNFYLGYGVKKTDPTFVPISPPDVNADPDDPVEQPEPTPLQAPEELESDSEEEKKDEEEEED
ncbi:hypothetical protein SteCoe_1167 [Stentor coeruleus]|uniref:Radial spokehead-like protein n=1 Tax=Stentor coeruleus TaxID=5963 RepID=A0A1R2D2G9_9CILI|nr:hypothetical protein SteCoe_1167 [Stentor coeruleus]